MKVKHLKDMGILLAIGFILWYVVPYLFLAFMWVLGWVVGLPLWWILDGGPSKLLTSVVSTGQWLWSFILFQSLVLFIAGAVAGIAFRAVRNHRNYVDGLKAEINRLGFHLQSAQSQYRSLAHSNLDIISALEMVRRRALTQQARVRSQSAELMRIEVEEILERHPFNRFSLRAEELCAEWNRAFALKVEMLLRSRKQQSPH